MRKMIRKIGICLCISSLVWVGGIIADRERLNENLIRLHVVAASDSREDQDLKLLVRDAVTESLQEAMADIRDTEQAKAYLQENLDRIGEIANGVLASNGCQDTAVVTLCKEVFDVRHYDTFSLPSGIYDALRITIGEGQGHNWWCVVFPSLCIPATSDGFSDVAVGAGFPDALTAALEGEAGYEIRFFLLEALGELEIMLQGG